MRRKGRLARDLARRGAYHVRAVFLDGSLQELPDRFGIAQGAMARTAGDAVARDQAVQIVARVLRVQAPRQAHGTQGSRVKPDSAALEGGAQKTVVETRVVRDEHAARETRMQIFGERLEARRIRHHRVGDSGECLDRGGNRRARIDEGRPLGRYLAALRLEHGDLGYAIPGRMRTRGLEIDDREGLGE